MDYNLTNKELQLIRNWRTFQNNIINFQNKANNSLFTELYGKEEGLKLLSHFVNKCNKNYLMFETFLTKKTINYASKFNTNTI